MKKLCKILGVNQSLDDDIKVKVNSALKDEDIQYGRKVLKLIVSEKNIVTCIRTNTYQREDYKKGFTVAISNVRRNETSPFTYHKTLNYGDCIMEKRHARKSGIDEPVFLNTKGEIAEGATTNVFFVKNKEIFTPPLSCGLLPGIIREYLLHTFKIQEKIILPEDVTKYDEMFLTNSLLGIMPVRKMEQHDFESMNIGTRLSQELFQG